MWFYDISGLRVASEIEIISLKPIENASASAGVDVRFIEGSTPRQLTGSLFSCDWFDVSRDELIVRTAVGLTLHIFHGQTITVERGEATSDADVALFIMGSGWGAICQQRGLFPIHCSSVVHDNQVIAFAGNSGAGKSTLATALGQKGYQLFSDDVCLLDPGSADGAYVWPSPKGVKLWREAGSFLDVEMGRRVTSLADIDKYFVDVDAHSGGSPLPLKLLYVLDDGASIFTQNIRGIDLIDQLFANLYRLEWFQYMQDRRTILLEMSRCAKHFKAFRFSRPNDLELFSEGLEVLETHFLAQLECAE